VQEDEDLEDDTVTSQPKSTNNGFLDGPSTQGQKSSSMLLAGTGIAPGAGNKVMVLGKKFDPMSDENYKQLVTLENKAKTAEMKVADIATEISDIDIGHLDKYLHQGAFKSLQKRVNGLNEELQKMLESLDGFQLNEDQLEAKIKRKSLATMINKVMDKNDTNLEKVTK